MICVKTTIPTVDVVPEPPSWKNQIVMGWDTIRPSQIWAEYKDIPPAITEGDASAAAVADPTLIRDYTLSGEAVHLTSTAEPNVYFMTEFYGDLSTKLENWIAPRFIPRIDGFYTGLPSMGYAAKLYNGNPISGGIEIPDMLADTGYIQRWRVNYGFGAVSIGLASSEVIDEDDLWITGFRYVGQTWSGVI